MSGSATGLLPKLLDCADVDTLRGKRNQAMLSLLIGCGLRRAELLGLVMSSMQLREEHWVVRTARSSKRSRNRLETCEDQASLQLNSHGRNIRLFSQSSVSSVRQRAAFLRAHLGEIENLFSPNELPSTTQRVRTNEARAKGSLCVRDCEPKSIVPKAAPRKNFRCVRCLTVAWLCQQGHAQILSSFKVRPGFSRPGSVAGFPQCGQVFLVLQILL